MHVVAAICPQGLDGPPLVLGTERAHPQDQSAAVELLLQAVRMTLLEEARESGPDEAAAQAPT